MKALILTLPAIVATLLLNACAAHQPASAVQQVGGSSVNDGIGSAIVTCTAAVTPAKIDNLYVVQKTGTIEKFVSVYAGTSRIVSNLPVVWNDLRPVGTPLNIVGQKFKLSIDDSAAPDADGRFPAALETTINLEFTSEAMLCSLKS